MDRLFKIHSIIFHQNESILASKYFSLLMFCLYEFIIFCQITALIKEPYIDENASGPESFWKFFSFFDVFKVSLNFAFTQELTVFIIAIITSQFLLITISYLLDYFKKTIPKLLKFFMKLNYIVLCQVLMVPTLNLLFITFMISEDLNSIKKDQVLEFGLTGKMVMFLLLLCEILLIAFYDCFGYTVRHRPDDRFKDSKIHPKCEIYSKTAYLLSIFTQTLKKNSLNMYLVVNMIMFLSASMLLIHHLPFYSFRHNFVRLYFQANLFFLCLFFIISNLQSNNLVSIVLFIFVQPGIMMICYTCLNKSYASKTRSGEVENFANFEFKLREDLLNKNKSSEILTKMNQNFIATKQNMNLVLQAYYSLDFIDNCTLALNKARWITIKSFNLYENFQIYNCKLIVKEICKSSSTTYEFFKFFNKINDLKALDSDFCYSLLKFQTIILSNKPDVREYNRSVEELSGLLKSLQNKYKEMVSRFPESSELKDMYKSFLLEIMKDEKNGNEMILLSNQKYLKARRLGCLSLKNQGILVLSGNREDSGKIIFASKAFLKMTGYTYSGIRDGNLDMLVPRFLEKLHPGHLAGFAAKSKSHIAFPPVAVFFVDSEGFIIECITNIECICVNSSIRFLSYMYPVKRLREYALISKNEFILEHSRGLTSLLMTQRKYIKDLFIQEFVIIPDLYSLENNPTKIKINNSTSEAKYVYGICKDFSIMSTSLFFLYICDINEEITKWKTCSDFFETTENPETSRDSKVKSKQKSKIPNTRILNTQNTSTTTYSNSTSIISQFRPFFDFKRFLKIQKLILILIVKTNQVAILISCNISSIVYLALQTKDINELQASNDLRFLSGNFLKLGAIALSFNVESLTYEKFGYDMNDLQTIYEKLEDF